jgi:hypothetical protein
METKRRFCAACGDEIVPPEGAVEIPVYQDVTELGSARPVERVIHHVDTYHPACARNRRPPRS